MDSEEIRKRLETVGHMEEVSEVRYFDGYRKNKKGQMEDVTVKILDMGPNNPQYRYNCIASTPSGLEARGNGGASLDEAILLVHWNKLD
jgi:hypothetical protein